ncbi:MAG: hypothetical protein ACI89G_000281 [Minisyncoccia bacterium]|jgi:hypothetical protein
MVVSPVQFEVQFGVFRKRVEARLSLRRTVAVCNGVGRTGIATLGLGAVIEAAAGNVEDP